MPVCGWQITDWPPAYTSADADAKAAAEALAASTLWALSGRVFGVCQETITPIVEPAQPSTYDGPGGAAGRITGVWAATTYASGTSDRCAQSRDRVALPGPVQEVTEVRVAGQLVDANAYQVHNLRWLVRIDGQLWPVNAAAADFTVTYRRGLPIPATALIVLVDLAVEFLKARTGSGKCTIPTRAQQVTRQGVDIQLIDPATLFDNGLTGVESVDRWLATVNPGMRRAPSRVYSPDRRAPIRVR